MSIQSNIETYYEEQVEFAVETALTCIRDDHEDEETALHYAIDNAFYIYGCDHAYTIAHAYNEGLIKRGEQIDWEAIDLMIYDDVYRELQEQLKKGEEE